MKYFVTLITILISTVSSFAQFENNPAMQGPVIRFDRFDYDFGNITEGDLAAYEFKFTNVGKMPLVILNVQAQCGCTSPEWTKDTIAPGGTGKIKAVYNSYQRPGPFEKYLTVKTNTLQGEITLKIKGDVLPKPIEPISPVRNPQLEN
jgi:hypothetical protein